MESRLTRLDYCQFLLSSQINDTLTYFAEHFRRFSHDIEACQCRRARIQRNHIGCAILVWVRLKALAHPDRKHRLSDQARHALARAAHRNWCSPAFHLRLR